MKRIRPTPTPSAAESARRERNCYCDLWQTSPDFLRKEGVPPGFCGRCDRCGAPGHTRHYPGPVPVTGAWCDECYRRLKWTALLRRIAGWLIVAALFAAFMAGVRSMLRGNERVGVLELERAAPVFATAASARTASIRSSRGA